MTGMSNDPNDITSAIAYAQDAFDGTATFGQPTYEDGIVSEDDWTAQLTKGCQLIDGARTIRDHNGHHTAVIELCFGAIERSLQAWLLSQTGDEPEDLQDHETPYQRADDAGLFDGVGEQLGLLYQNNRTQSYYANRTPTEEQANTMFELAQAIHDYVADLIDRGYCHC